MFDRHYIIFFPKENVRVLVKKLCVYGCVVSFLRILYFSFKTTIVCQIFSVICYEKR